VKCHYYTVPTHDKTIFIPFQQKKNSLEPKYEGRSINKLQNSVILLVFQILKIWNIRFVGNLILSSSCDHDDDVNVTQVLNIKYGDVDSEILL